MSVNSTPQATSRVSTFDCPNCAAPVSIRIQGQSLSVVCPSCRCVLDAQEKGKRVLEYAKQVNKLQYPLALGSRGKIRGLEWEVVGYIKKCDETRIYYWDEYLLFNPFKGYRWLSCYEGHWNFVTMLSENPKVLGDTAYFNNKYYRIFLKGQAIVVDVLGEFYWKIARGDTAKIAEYICAPEILSFENSGDEKSWALGTYISRAEMEEAFKVSLSYSMGVGANEPNRYDEKLANYSNNIWIFCVALIFIQGLAMMTADNKVLSDYSYTLSAANHGKEILSEDIQVPYSRNLDFVLYSNLTNDWLSLDVDLVNQGTGQSLDVSEGIEYYSGIDGGESWSEGSREAHYFLYNVPAGTYKLTITPTSGSVGSGQNSSQDFRLTVKKNVVNWGLFLLSFFALVIPYLFFLFFRYNFEVRRWSSSDYSPYASGDDDD